jgi:hypothetical protein
MAATSRTANSESARSRALERGLAGVASNGGMAHSNYFNCAPGFLVSPRCRTFRSAVSVRRPASRARLTSWGRSIRPWFERGRTSGIRTFGNRIRTAPIPALTATCDSAGRSGSAAARWRKHARKILADIRAWRSLRGCRSVAERAVRADEEASTMAPPRSHAVFNIVHFEKLNPSA